MSTHVTSTMQRTIDLTIELPPHEVLRAMGCARAKPVRVEIQRVLDRVLIEARRLMQPRGVYRVFEVAEMTDGELRLKGCPPICGPIAGFLKPAKRVAAFVVTIGDELEEKARQQMNDGEMLEGYILDAVGSAAADLASEAMADTVFWNEAHQDEAITPPFSPGYCGLPLEEQKTIFSIVDPGPIGVQLWPTLIMEPIKSVSGLLGIGPSVEVIERGVPCQYCELQNCRMRR